MRTNTLMLALAVAVAGGCQGIDAQPPTVPSPAGPTTSEVLGAPVPAPDGGRGINSPGILLAVTPRIDGDLDVVEHVVFREPTGSVLLHLPSAGSAAPTLENALPAALDVQVVADDNRADSTLDEVRSSQVLPVASVTRLELTYRLTGAAVRNTPSRQGRALAVIAPLTASTDPTLPTNLVVNGPGLRNAMCPRLPETRCAAGKQPWMSIRPGIPADRAVAVLQLDLPNPTAR